MHGSGIGVGTAFADKVIIGLLLSVIAFVNGDILLIPIEIDINFYGVTVDAGSGDVTYSSSGILPDLSLHIP